MRYPSVKYASGNKEIWREVLTDLQKKGHTIKSISNLIGSDFGHQLYSNQGLNLESLTKLEQIYGKKIDNLAIYTKGERISRSLQGLEIEGDFEINVNLAEIFGIILGDGGLSEKTLAIYCNSNNMDYFNYVYHILSNHFVWDIKKYFRKTSNAAELKIHSKYLVRRLIALGLHIGDKKELQVSVPEWIKQNRQYAIACAKGLIDTDGCIYFENKKNNIRYINIHFTNKSQPLLEFMEEFCADNDIDYSRTEFRIYIRSQKSVKKFLAIVQPRRMIYKNVKLTDFK